MLQYKIIDSYTRYSEMRMNNIWLKFTKNFFEMPNFVYMHP